MGMCASCRVFQAAISRSVSRKIPRAKRAPVRRNSDTKACCYGCRQRTQKVELARNIQYLRPNISKELESAPTKNRLRNVELSSTKTGPANRVAAI